MFGWLFCSLARWLVSGLSSLVVCGFDSCVFGCGFRVFDLLASLLRFWFRSLFCGLG